MSELIPFPINLADPIPEKHEAFAREFIQGLIAQNGRDKAWEMVKAFCTTLMQGDKVKGRQLAEAIVLDLLSGAPTTPGPVMPGNPGVIVPWREKIKRPMIFISAPDYFWTEMNAAMRRQWLVMVRDAGFTGVDIEVGGPQGAINYIKGINPKPNLDERESKQFVAFMAWLSDCRELDLVISAKFWNCNGDASGKSVNWWLGHAKNFAAAVGSDNILALPGNERDRATSDDRRRALYLGFIDGGFPASQLIGYDSKSEYGINCGFVETHPQKDGAADLKGSDFTHINCTDSRPSISFCYDNWLKLDGIGGKPKLSNIRDLVRRSKARKTSLSLYSFRQIPDPEALSVAAIEWNGGATAPTAPRTGDALDISNATLLGPHKNVKPLDAVVTRRLNRAEVTGPNSMSLDYEKLGWPARKTNPAGVHGRVFIFWENGGGIAGGHFDWLRDGTTTRDFKNIANGYLDGQRPEKGGRVWSCIVSDNGRERTNIVESPKRYMA